MATLTAPGKINLNLRITGRRDDGYRFVDSLVVFAGLHDVLTITQSDTPSFTITNTGEFDNDTDNNIITRAITAFRNRTGITANYDIALEKNIPLAAGLGGGSADAAATLALLNTIHENPLDETALNDIARELGADVPVCLAWQVAQHEARNHHCWRMRGIGHDLTRHELASDLGIVLVNNDGALSTAEVFAAHDGTMSKPQKDYPATITINKDLITNDLIGAATGLRSGIAATIAMLEDLCAHPGYIGSGMTGSGATCFALFESPHAAQSAAAALPPHLWSWAGGLASGRLS